MAKKKTAKKSDTEQLEVSVKNKKEKMSWAGASVFMTKAVPGSKQEKEQKLIRITAKALDISPFGVNILGDLPYINKLGLVQKGKQYVKDFTFETNWVQFATDDTMKAICEKRLLYLKGDVEYKGERTIGECSPATTKMTTLKGYQNQIAETRAKNRAILAEFGDRIHEDLLKGIYQLAHAEEATPDELAKIGNSASSSAEEIQFDRGEKVYGREDVDAKARKEFKQYALKKGAKIGEEVKFIAETLGLTEKDLDFDNLTAKDIFKTKTLFMSRVKEPAPEPSEDDNA